METMSATEAVNVDSILSLVKPKTIKIGVHSFSAQRLAIKRDNEKPSLRLVTGGSLLKD